MTNSRSCDLPSSVTSSALTSISNVCTSLPPVDESRYDNAFLFDQWVSLIYFYCPTWLRNVRFYRGSTYGLLCNHRCHDSERLERRLRSAKVTISREKRKLQSFQGQNSMAQAISAGLSLLVHRIEVMQSRKVGQ